MMDSDFPLIQPVENLQNVAALTGADQHQERKRRQNPSRSQPRSDALPPKQAAEQEASERADNTHTIDYQA